MAPLTVIAVGDDECALLQLQCAQMAEHPANLRVHVRARGPIGMARRPSLGRWHRAMGRSGDSEERMLLGGGIRSAWQPDDAPIAEHMPSGRRELDAGVGPSVIRCVHGAIDPAGVGWQRRVRVVVLQPRAGRHHPRPVRPHKATHDEERPWRRVVRRNGGVGDTAGMRRRQRVDQICGEDFVDMLRGGEGACVECTPRLRAFVCPWATLVAVARMRPLTTPTAHARADLCQCRASVRGGVARAAMP